MNAEEHEQVREWLLRTGEERSPLEQQAIAEHLISCEACRSYSQILPELERELREVFHARWDPIQVPAFEQRMPGTNRMRALPALAVAGIAIVLILAMLLRSPLAEMLSKQAGTPTSEAVLRNPSATHTGQAVMPATESVSEDHLIAFVSRRDGNREIYVMSALGEDAVNLTRNPAQDYAPVWSPDGKRIAFISNRNGQPELFVMQADGSQVTELSVVPGTRAYGEPSWSPDGRQLAVQLILEYPFTGEAYTQIYLVATDGTGAVAMSQTEFPLSSLEPVWSPVGDRIASRTLGIVQARPHGASQGEPEQIRLSRGLANVGSLAWSPDGSHLAYFASCQYCLEDKGLAPAVYLIEADGDHPQVLHAFNDQKLYGIGLSWSPDGSQILLLAAEEQSGNQHLFLISAGGAQMASLADFPAGAMESVPSWSPDGSQLVYALQENGESGIYVLDLPARLGGDAAGGLMRLGASRRGDSTPRWQP
jgi:TolB protein